MGGVVQVSRKDDKFQQQRIGDFFARKAPGADSSAHVPDSAPLAKADATVTIDVDIDIEVHTLSASLKPKNAGSDSIQQSDCSCVLD